MKKSEKEIGKKNGSKSCASSFLPDPEEQRALESAGIRRIPLDVPFPVDPVNLVVVLGERPALVDSGLHYLENWQRLEDGLADVGLRVEDLAEVWLTHPHLDHFGMTARVVERSGARVRAWGPSVARFEAYESFWEEDRIAFLELLSRSEVQKELIERTKSVRSHFASVAGSIRVDHPFELETSLQMAGEHRVIPLHVPGHSPWCIAFWLEDVQVLLSGDVLLERVTSNPLYYPREAAPADWQGLVAYRNSLRHLRELPIQRVIPGHGASFDKHVKKIDRALRHQERRQARIVECLQEGPCSAYQVACAVFGEGLTQRSLFLVMSESIRHLEWLVMEQKVELVVTESSSKYQLL